MTKIYAHCDRTGVVTFSDKPDLAGQLCIGSGVGQAFKDEIEVLCRLAYDNKSMLVPGVPEATSSDEALKAVWAFMDLIKQRQKVAA